MKHLRISFPHPPGSGGPGSFQSRFEEFLKRVGIAVTYAGSCVHPDIIIVVGGTRRLGWLLKMKLKKVPIIYRLDGLNWLHKELGVHFSKYLIDEYRNVSNKLLHAFIADFIVYQSQFVLDWWLKCGWRKRKKYTIITNGIDIDKFMPLGLQNEVRIVCLEGTIDYSPYVVNLLNSLRSILPDQIRIEVYGRFQNQNLLRFIKPEIDYKGSIERNKVPEVFQNAIYLSLDINPACPNTVIEALACGAPVVGFDTGALSELVPDKAGIIVPYGSDPWRLKYPNDRALCIAILKIYHNWDSYSKGARDTATYYFNQNNTFQQYLHFINLLVDERKK